MKNILLLNYGVTYRVKSKGPACLLKVSPRKTLLEKQVFILNKAFPSATIFIVSGLKQKKIKNLSNYNNVRIIENEKQEDTNCLYSVSLVLDKFKVRDSLFIIPGNTYFKENLFNTFNSKQSQLWLTHQYQELGCTLSDNKIQNVMWTLPNYWSNICYFYKKEFDLLHQIVSDKSLIEKLFLFEAINSIIDKGGNFDAVLKKNKIKFINKISDLQ